LQASQEVRVEIDSPHEREQRPRGLNGCTCSNAPDTDIELRNELQPVGVDEAV
jgi:hypothetical protein